MKILILANNDTGLFLFRKELLQRLIEEGHTVYVSVPSGTMIQRLKGLGCKVTTCDLLDRRGKNPVKDLSLLHYYDRLLLHVRPDCVLSYTVKPNAYGGMACARRGVPFIANVTGLGDAIMRGGMLAKVTLLLYRQGLKKADCVFFQNEENLSFFRERGITRGKTRLLPGSGVNTREYPLMPYPADEGEIRFLYAGRIMKDKGIEELLTAMRRLRKETRILLDIAGACDEDYEEALRTAEKEGLLFWHGMVEDVRPLYARAHCVVLPSYHEGMSNVLQEAASCGRVTIASDVSGCKEIVDDGNTGFLCKPHDAESLYRAMVRFLQIHPSVREEMGKAARKRMEERFDRARVIDAYLEETGEIFDRTRKER